jgi:hypothetical protein
VGEQQIERAFAICVGEGEPHATGVADLLAATHPRVWAPP